MNLSRCSSTQIRTNGTCLFVLFLTKALGDMLIFRSVLAHRSGPNLTKKRRAAVFGTYHFQLDQPDFALRPSARFMSSGINIDTNAPREREKGEAYKEGCTMFAYSSPFTKPKVSV